MAISGGEGDSNGVEPQTHHRLGIPHEHAEDRPFNTHSELGLWQNLKES